MIRNNKVKNIIKHILYFLFCQAIFICIFSLIMINFGPYTNVKSIILGTSTIPNSPKTISKTDKVKIHNNVKVKVVKKTQLKTKPLAKKDNGISIVTIRRPNYSGILMLIKDPSRMNVGLTPYLRHAGATLKEIITKSGAVGGLNAGGFVDTNRMGTGGCPTGIIIQNGKITYTERKAPAYSIIGFNYANHFVTSNSMSIQNIKKAKLRCAATFGPVLISCGRRLGINKGFSAQPRSAIGQRKDGTVLLLAIDGRQAGSRGASISQVQNELLKYGAYNAANLDGGSSTTIVYRDRTLNNPSDIVGDRSIPSAFIVMPQKN